MIVDAHHHLWDPSQRAYPWMTDDLAPIAHRFGVEDFERALPEDVAATIVVQAVSSLEESEALLRVAAETPRIAGVVAWVDLTADAASQIAHLRSIAGGEKLVGIRHQVQDEEDAQWLLRADVRNGLAAIAQEDLAYDLLVRARELPCAYETAKRFPQLRFILDHGGKPPIATGATQAWRIGVARLATLPNVACKLSGLVTEAAWNRWAPSEILPYAHYLLAAFGARRMLFGSDWPVCLLAATYDDVLSLAARACVDLTAEEREALFSTNALRYYHLKVTA